MPTVGHGGHRVVQHSGGHRHQHDDDAVVDQVLGSLEEPKGVRQGGPPQGANDSSCDADLDDVLRRTRPLHHHGHYAHLP